MPIGPIEAQVAAETLGIAGLRLRRALDALALHDQSDKRNATVRADLLADAGDAFWRFVVQREHLGLRDPEFVAEAFGVPTEVWQSMKPKLDTP